MKLSEHFETRKRDDDTWFVTLKDDRPDWLHDAVMSAHDGEMPNDWRYQMCLSIVTELDGYDDIHSDDLFAGQIADDLTSIYTSDLLDWLSGNAGRLTYCDDVEEKPSTMFELMQAGQYECIRQIGDVLEAVRENAEES